MKRNFHYCNFNECEVLSVGFATRRNVNRMVLRKKGGENERN